MVELFLMMASGYALAKFGLMDGKFSRRLSRLVVSFTLPCLIFSSVCGQKTEMSQETVLYLLGVGLVILLILPLIGYAVIYGIKVRKDRRGLYIFMVIFSNTSFMGFPVLNAIYGQQGIVYMAILNMVLTVFMFTLGVALMRPEGSDRGFSLQDLLSPGMTVSVLSLIFYLLHVPIPQVALHVTEVMGSTTTPLAMLITGASLAQIPLRELFVPVTMYPFAVFKQIVLPLIALPVLTAAVPDPIIRGTAFFVIAMPVANNAVIFAENYGAETTLAAKVVFLTTVMSLVTIPFMVQFL